MSNENINIAPHQVTQESTAEQVQQWFCSPGNEDFAEYGYLFGGLKGSRVLGFSVDDFKGERIPGMTARALWNALHPITEKITLVDDESGRSLKKCKLKEENELLKEEIRMKDAQLKTKDAQLKTKNTHLKHIFSKTTCGDYFPVHLILTEEEAEVQEAWIALYRDNYCDLVVRPEQLTTFYETILPGLNALQENPNPNEETDVHPIIFKILMFVKENLSPDMVIYAECDKSTRHFPANTEKQPDFLMLGEILLSKSLKI
eukprot:TRINITY_DN5690_c0_g3_i1.p1 TRINITY_DN5690_c0_g3~~TRINITY_DN5690_c0_g3_i1.p1  ORF type:complete len:260 (+),score=58.44 TRINITY_DN5690_c0_g3_i1:236-1015(+)